jgi:hypothetical protein
MLADIAAWRDPASAGHQFGGKVKELVLVSARPVKQEDQRGIGAAALGSAEMI